MKIIFMGSVQFSYALLEKLMEHPQADIVGIISKETSSFNADFCSLIPLAKKKSIPYYIDHKNNQKEMSQWVRETSADIIYCFGWSNLLKDELLQSVPLGVVGYHPSLLPKNRGRHPIVWALALGLPETGSSFFKMDLGADSGQILDQEVVPISYEEDALSLYQKLQKVAHIQVDRITSGLADKTLEFKTQDHTLANHWRKREKNDGKIDWRMSSRSIYNLVRALTRPYVGAHVETMDGDIKVWKVREIPWDDSNHEPGKILQVKEDIIIIKCGHGAIALVEHEFKNLPAFGHYL